jgi:hypothetical protein
MVGFLLRGDLLVSTSMSSINNNNNNNAGGRETELQREMRLAEAADRADEEGRGAIVQAAVEEQARAAVMAETRRLESVALVWRQSGRQEEVTRWLGEATPEVRRGFLSLRLFS